MNQKFPAFPQMLLKCIYFKQEKMIDSNGSCDRACDVDHKIDTNFPYRFRKERPLPLGLDLNMLQKEKRSEDNTCEKD